MIILSIIDELISSDQILYTTNFENTVLRKLLMWLSRPQQNNNLWKFKCLATFKQGNQTTTNFMQDIFEELHISKTINM